MSFSNLPSLNSLAQIDPNLLSVTGVIATILAVIFGLGAFYNSRTRRRHLAEMEKAQRQEQPMHFRPAKSHPASRSVGRSRGPHVRASASTSRAPVSAGRASTPREAPVAKASSIPKGRSSTPAKSSKMDDKQNIFRKVRPDGIDLQDSKSSPTEETYAWE